MFPETSYISCTQPMTPLVVPTKTKFAILPLSCCTDMKATACSFVLEEILYFFCPDRFAAAPCKGWCVRALILCAFQSIVGNFEAVPFLRLHFRVCRLPFISVSFAHCDYPSRSPCGSERCWNTAGSPIAVPYLFQFLALPLTWLSDLASLWVFSSMTGIFLPTSHNPECLQPRVLDMSFLLFCSHWSIWSLIDSPRQSRGLK